MSRWKQEWKVYIIFLGAPGAGKGTQADRAAEALGLVHISSGDLFRQAVERGDELGLKVKTYMNEGMLVPDEITINVILGRISEPDCRAGAILDGFPRDLKQAEALDEALKKEDKAIDWVIYIRVPDGELIKRLSGRWLCRNCQTPYRLSAPPEIKNRCDLCGGELYQRPDDTPGTVKKRLEVYFAQTVPLIEYYKKQGKLLEIDGQGSIDSVTDRVTSALREHELIIR